MPNPRANRSRSDAPRQLLLSASAPAPQGRSCSVPALLLRSLRSCSAAAPLLRSNACSVPQTRGSALAPPRRPGQPSSWLRSGAFALSAPLLCHGAPVSSPLCRRFPCQQQLRQGGASYQAIRHGAPASSKPHLAEKSTAVWLASWRIWAGVANSQRWRATFRSTYLYMCPSALLPL